MTHILDGRDSAGIPQSFAVAVYALAALLWLAPDRRIEMHIRAALTSSRALGE